MPFYLGLAGSQAELTYPDTYSAPPVVRGSLIDLGSGDVRLHYVSERREIQISWKNLQAYGRGVILTEFQRHQELSLVDLAGQSWPVLFLVDGYHEDPVAGSDPVLYDVSISLVQCRD